MVKTNSIVKYPDQECAEGKTHYFIHVAFDIWICKHCKKAKWQPGIWTSALQFAESISRHGLEKAYERSLQTNPKIKEALEKLEELRMVSENLSLEEFVDYLKDNILTNAFKFLDVKTSSTRDVRRMYNRRSPQTSGIVYTGGDYR